MPKGDILNASNIDMPHGYSSSKMNRVRARSAARPASINSISVAVEPGADGSVA